MSGNGAIVLRTPRLTLRELTEDDLDAVFAILDDAEVSRVWGMSFGRDEARAWIRDQRERYRTLGYGYWMATDASGACVGQAGLVPIAFDGREEPALGWITGAGFRCRGYATEAAAGACRFAFDRLELPRVITMIRPMNVASRRVAAKLGMRRAGCMLLAGLDHVVYRLPRADRFAAEEYLRPLTGGDECCS